MNFGTQHHNKTCETNSFSSVLFCFNHKNIRRQAYMLMAEKNLKRIKRVGKVFGHKLFSCNQIEKCKIGENSSQLSANQSINQSSIQLNDQNINNNLVCFWILHRNCGKASNAGRLKDGLRLIFRAKSASAKNSSGEFVGKLRTSLRSLWSWSWSVHYYLFETFIHIPNLVSASESINYLFWLKLFPVLSLARHFASKWNTC